MGCKINQDILKVTIVLPCFNEVTNIGEVISRIMNIGWDKESFEISIIDDGSTDGTQELLLALGEQNPNINIEIQANRLGLGKSIYRGIEKARGRYIVLMDTDGMHDPSYLNLMLSKAQEGFALVIASRYVHGAIFQGSVYPVMSKLINTVIKWIMKSKISDQLCGFFLSDASELKKINAQFFDGFGEYFIAVIQHFEEKGFPIIEIPSVHNVRVSGERKSRRLKMLTTYIRYAIRYRKNLSAH